MMDQVIVEDRRHAVGERRIHPAPGFIDHPERAVIESALDVLTGFALIAKFEIVDRSRAVEGDGVQDSLAHGRHENGIEAHFDGMRAHHENHGAFRAHGGRHGVHGLAQVPRGEKIGQAVQKSAQGAAGGMRPGKGLRIHLVGPFRDWIGADLGEIQGIEFHRGIASGSAGGVNEEGSVVILPRR